MNAGTTRRLTAGRIVTLALIVLAMAGLAYLRVKPDSEVWLAGVVTVLTTMRGVPLDDELLAALAVGLPVGLGIFLTWLNRDQSARSRMTGFSAALGGALLGAWLGFNATEGLFALLTTLVGATAGSNLLLLALDLVWDPHVASRSLETARVPGRAGLRTQEDPS